MWTKAFSQSKSKPSPSPHNIPHEKTHDYRKLVSSTNSAIDAEFEFSQAVQLSLQGQWTKWVNYVGNDFSWNTLFTMPTNLVSFCIAATFNTLPSPSNLARWHISTEGSCFLCKKSVCTVAHILGACKVSLQQGRYTFRHDSVLSKLVESIKEFLKGAKPIPSKNHTVKFVKAGTRSKNSYSKHHGILHLAGDWHVLCDLSSDYLFPVHIATTALRPDIVIFSNKIKRVILIELTCPCEENMESWHNTKLSKYHALKTIIESNGWRVDLIAIEVGARGFPSTTLTNALKKLGYNNKLTRLTSKALGRIAMECSFCIWVARNSKTWETDKVSDCSSLQRETILPKPSPKINTPEKATRLVKTNISQGSTRLPKGFVNKGNTCYANSILQALSVLPLIWCKVPSETSNISPLLKAIALNMTMKQSSKRSTIDPSNFLWALKRKISITKPFDFNLQQDVPEILTFVLDELKGASVQAQDYFNTTLRTTVTCNICLLESLNEETTDFVILPPKESLSSSITSFLSSEDLDGDNKVFCNFCENKTNSSKQLHIIKTGAIFIVQLRRFVQSANNFVKDKTTVECTKTLVLPLSENEEVTFKPEYELVASINHSGNLNAGHYWAYIKDCNIWYSCDDKSVKVVDRSVLNNASSYVLFYKRTQGQAT